ncbi:transcriptional regulator [Mycobacterium tuberculosis]|nr:transcriptional regulator [Mycobacterium tuberculosis]
MRILVVEDEPKMTALLARALTEEGHTVDTVADGRHAVAAVDGGDYDAVVLDVMLPGIDGFEVCARLRRQRVWTPVLMLTARGAVTDRIAGLDGGADDYLTKPFNLDELFARLRALSRRGPIPRPPTLEAGDLRLDPSEHRVWRADTEIRLSHKEFTLLEALIRRPGIVHTRAQLLERCWDAAYEARSNIVDVYIRYLRDKIDRPFGVTSLETIRGDGTGCARTEDGMRSPAEWPIRWRLTLVFSAAMALVLAAAGAVTVVQFRDAAHEADPDGALRGLTDDITADLVRELVTILPIVLVIAAVAAYLLSRAALRPVDRIRAAAQTLTTTPHPDTDAPLPVPPTDDEIAWLATTLNTMLTRLQRALAHEQQFVADASHELRTPLALLTTELELRCAGPDPPTS